MTARLTDDEIRKLRYYRDACVHSPEWRLTFMGIPMDTALDRLLDELLEHRAREKLEKWREIPLPAGVAEFIKMNKANASKAVQP